MSEYLYKETENEFISDIPTHWDFKRLGSFGVFKKGRGIAKSDIVEEGINAVLYGDIYTKYDLKVEVVVRRITEEISKGATKIIKNDILITGSGETIEEIGKTVVYLNHEPAFAGGDLLIFKQKSYDSLFISFVLNSSIGIAQKARTAKGDIVVHTYSSKLKNIRIPIPPVEEQKAIADYLEKACAKIDDVIEMKRRQLKKIDKYFKSRIFELLKGSDLGEVEFSNSEFEWIGSIPRTWDIFRLKHISSKINSGVTPKGGADVYVDEGVPMLRSQNITFERLDIDYAVKIPEEVHNSMSNSKLRRGDVLLNITGASLGRCNFFDDDDIEANVNQHVCIIRPRFQILTKFLFYLLNSEIGQAQIFSGFKGSGREGLNFESIKNFRLPVPDIKSQEKIIERLDKISDSVKKQKNLIDLQISRLTNYRESLIHECVTGKKNVFEGEPESLKAEAV